ncbi:single-stranded-DNA-specific exonuclease RecJ [uncultured Dialister sp.]|jgi:single-stranded-DNA-specific exonuclease|uniref:single-stranded-DNA-specific exonuclease RecJ n=1 Tax=uncultured Dialister sp. TaxID=278064 RepID=UPI0025D8E5AC|nr:single-stranded-DNA-specific exonuclease RecJ [uncultured Dialister sp.]
MEKQTYKWNIKAPHSEKREVPGFFSSFSIPVGLARILLRRGIDSEEKLSHFLYDDLSNLSDPFLMKGMTEAVDRISRALDGGEKIVIYGDYDVDGITSTSIMVRGLKGLNGNVGYYIPQRETEGYGLNGAALSKLAGEGYSLLITVDCGISSADLIAKAPKSLDIIVTDHHTPPEVLPRCVSVINPHQKDCPYPYKELAGCGVAYSLCRALYMKREGHDYDGTVELAALGTIADVVSLTGENRIIVKEGMKRFIHTPIKGLAALLKASGIVHEDTKEIKRADQVSFGLAPRLNAAGRIAQASEGVKLMTTDSMEEAESLARKLCETNVARQTIERDIFDQAKERIAELHMDRDMAFVVDGKDWHPGVIGIVASRILEIYHRPVFVITIRNGVGKGSCRSIPAFNIYEALSKQSDLLLQFGGHKMAAGFSIAPENIPEFRRRMNDYARSVLTEEDCLPVLDVEESLPLDDITLDFIHSLDLLEPCGCDNPKPLFSTSGAFVETTRHMGADGRHFKCQLSGKSGLVDAIFWGCGENSPCQAGDVVDLVFEPEVHEWYGEHVQLIGKDLRQEKTEILDRDYLVSVYRSLTGVLKDMAKPVKEVHYQLEKNGQFEPVKLGMALAVFEELEILSRFSRNGEDFYQRRIVRKKLDLLSSSVYRKHMCQ